MQNCTTYYHTHHRWHYSPKEAALVPVPRPPSALEELFLVSRDSLVAFYPRFGRKSRLLLVGRRWRNSTTSRILLLWNETNSSCSNARSRETALGVRPLSLPTASPVNPCGTVDQLPAGLAWPGPPTLSGFLRLLLNINHQSALRASYPGVSGLVHFPSHPDPCP